jgi:hemerythrin
MLQLDYPAYEEHRELHQEMRAKVRDLTERYQRDEVRAGELHVLVVSWLIKHISKEDLRIADYLRDQEDAA